jgi:GNAT superfamily N-acetyltransferase
LITETYLRHVTAGFRDTGFGQDFRAGGCLRAWSAPDDHVRNQVIPVVIMLAVAFAAGSVRHMGGLTGPAGSSVQIVTAQQRPDLWEQARAGFRETWPEYNLHGNRSGEYFGELIARFARFQLLLYDTAAGRVVARGRTIPLRWDGSMADLPAGIDAAGQRAVGEQAPPTALCALAAEVDGEQQGKGLSRQVLQAMVAAARSAGLGPLIAPVRPSLKDRYPLIPIEEYAHWRRSDGLPFDPWMRVHARLGATILRAEPRSMEITAPVADWEQWTGMTLPQPGEYVFAGGLAPLTVAGGVGRYWEPNVWMRHSV